MCKPLAKNLLNLSPKITALKVLAKKKRFKLKINCR